MSYKRSSQPSTTPKHSYFLRRTTSSLEETTATIYDDLASDYSQFVRYNGQHYVRSAFDEVSDYPLSQLPVHLSYEAEEASQKRKRSNEDEDHGKDREEPEELLPERLQEPEVADERPVKKVRTQESPRKSPRPESPRRDSSPPESPQVLTQVPRPRPESPRRDSPPPPQQSEEVQVLHQILEELRRLREAVEKSLPQEPRGHNTATTTTTSQATQTSSPPSPSLGPIVDQSHEPEPTGKEPRSQREPEPVFFVPSSIEGESLFTDPLKEDECESGPEYDGPTQLLPL
jgi:hypothetical protein